VTRQGILFSIVALVSALIGMTFHWQEFLLIGILLFTVLLVSALFVAYAPASSLTVRDGVVITTRLSETSFKVDINSGRKRGVFVACEDGPFPFRCYPVPRQKGKRTIRVPLDTHSRCDVESGPIHLVVADAFGLFRRTLASTQSVRIVVQPRVFDVPGHIRSRSRGDNDDGRVTGWGSQLSELVTEYNLGDEPRRIHWRTSAKVGKLMVRKELSPERTDVMLCLDTSADSYFAKTAFSAPRLVADFEVFHELFVSLEFAESKMGKNVRVLTSGTETTFDLRHGMAAPFLRHMANTELIRPGQIHVENVLRSAKQFRPRQILFITASPSLQTLNLLSELQRTCSVTLIGCNQVPDTMSIDLDSRRISLTT
jgi:uncharacterized protein (DUF58 family)